MNNDLAFLKNPDSHRMPFTPSHLFEHDYVSLAPARSDFLHRSTAAQSASVQLFSSDPEFSRCPERTPISSVTPISFSESLRVLYLNETFNLSASLHHRVAEFLGLKSGWDGENAKPLKPEVLAGAIGLLVFLKTSLHLFTEPFLAPTIDGFIVMEWHNDKRTLEFEATEAGWSIVGSQDSSNGEKIYHVADVDRGEITKLTAAFGWFDGTELLWPIQ
jgi:hypothetical protein